jgi:hypothetical protein
MANGACTNHMYCGLDGRGEGGARKQRTYSGAKCSIVERWFAVNANCFVKCICMQRIKCSWFLFANLAKQIHAFLLHQKQGYNTTQGTGANLQQRSSVADASITRLLSRLRSHCLSADLLCADWSLTKSRARLSRQF